MTEAFRGHVIDINEKGSDLAFTPDNLVIVDDDGMVQHNGPLSDISTGDLPDQMKSLGLQRVQYARGDEPTFVFRGETLEKGSSIIAPRLHNGHIHGLQSPAYGPGEPLIEFGPDGPYGWLVKTLQKGEKRAKMHPHVARKMLRFRLAKLALHGDSQATLYTTSSRQAVETALEIGDQIGMDVQAGYVCMDHGIDVFAEGLEITPEEGVRTTRELLDAHGRDHICVIDRFSIAVWSEFRQQLLRLTSEYGANFETHGAEGKGEGERHLEEYEGVPQITSVIQDIHAAGGTAHVSIAHMMRLTDEQIAAYANLPGRAMAIACPISNKRLRSVRDLDGSTHPFRWDALKEAGINIRIGTDHGAGAGTGVLNEMAAEITRAQVTGYTPPSHVELMRWGTINALHALEVNPATRRITPGNQAHFLVTRAPERGTLFSDTELQDPETLCRLLIEECRDPFMLKRSFVNGIDILPRARKVLAL